MTERAVAERSSPGLFVAERRLCGMPRAGSNQ
jgi:hypothetical protein